MNYILKPTQQNLSEIIEIAEKLRDECKNPLDAPKVGKAELATIIELVKDTCREADARKSGQAKIINAEDLFAGPFTPTKIEQQLSNFSIRGLIKFRRLLLRPQNLKSKDQSVIRELLNIDSLAKSALEKKIREAVREKWRQKGHPLAIEFCRKLKPWRAYIRSLGYDELATLDVGDIYPQLSVVLCECRSKFLITNCKDDSPDSLLNPIIGQLWLVMDNRVAEIKAEDEQKATGTNAGQKGTATTKRKSSKSRDIRKRFTFRKAQALFDGKDLGLPTGAELKPVEILKKLVKSFGKVVSYKKLDKNGLEKAASDLLRGKIWCINVVLQSKVPCKIESRRGEGYILTTSRIHS